MTLPTIAQAAPQIKSGKLAPMDLTEQCLAEIESRDDSIQAWVCVYPDEARQQAQAASAEIEQGRYRGPLHGIPIGIKDIIDVAGWPTKAGSPLREDHCAQEDSLWVRALRKAGAIFLGKTVTTQFACFDPPPTKNPWNLERTPGGSSSGSAAAVAAQMCVAALGSQTGGSITRPASFCGVTGLKPEFNLDWLAGVVPISHRLDHVGPMGKCVQDMDLIMSAAGWSSPALAVPTSPPTLYVWDRYFNEVADSQVANVTEAAISSLTKAGANIKTLQLPASFDDLHAQHRCVMAYDTLRHHREDFARQPEAYGPNITSLIEEGMDLNEGDYNAARQHQDQFRTELKETCQDVGWVILPSTVTTAPPLETTGDPAFNSPWSYAGVETLSIPCGLAADGLPCSLQFVAGDPLASHRGIVQWCEQVLGFDATP